MPKGKSNNPSGVNRNGQAAGSMTPRGEVPRTAQSVQPPADPDPTAKSHGRKYSPAQVAASLTRNKGVVSVVAQQLGIARWSVYRYINQYEAVRRAYDDQRASMLDLAELKLHEAIARGEAWAIQFALKTIGKERGYAEKADAGAGAGDLPNRFEFTLEIVTPNGTIERTQERSEERARLAEANAVEVDFAVRSSPRPDDQT
jgi:hypothetical protein